MALLPPSSHEALTVTRTQARAHVSCSLLRLISFHGTCIVNYGESTYLQIIQSKMLVGRHEDKPAKKFKRMWNKELKLSSKGSSFFLEPEIKQYAFELSRVRPNTGEIRHCLKTDRLTDFMTKYLWLTSLRQ